MTRVDPQMRIRLPQDVKDWLKKRAALSRRSQNGEIVYRLEAAMRADQKAEAPATGEGLRP